MNGCLNLYDAALRVLGAGLGTLGNHIPSFHDSLLLFNQDFEDLTFLTFILASEDDYLITFLNM